MPNVYVSQEAMVKAVGGGVRPAVDISPAKRFGELIILLPWSASKFDEPDGLVEILHAKLYAIQPEDYLLMAGSPTCFALAAIVASEYQDDLNFLLWDRSLNGGRGDYKAVPIRLGACQTGDRAVPSPSTPNTGARR